MKLNDNLPHIKNFIILHAILFMYSIGGVFAKLAAGESFLSFRYVCFYGIVVLNLFIYAMLWQQILKRMSLTEAYANKGITVIWGVVFGCLLFNESLSLMKVFGAVLVIAGIIIVVTDK